MPDPFRLLSRRSVPVAPVVVLLVAALVAALWVVERMPPRGMQAVEAAVPLLAEAGLAGTASSSRMITVHIPQGAESLARFFQTREYRLPPVVTGLDVPRLFPRELPRDLAAVEPLPRRKALFLRAVLPAVLRENERLRDLRRRVLEPRDALDAGKAPDAAQDAWLEALYAHYGVASGNLAALRRRMDEVPASLALAQAALESAWGTSRFAREGNALFGMWTWSEDVPGIVPLERPPQATYRVRAFESLDASVRAYMHALNTHRAYVGFRGVRERLRRAGHEPRGLALAGEISLYSTERGAYTANLRTLIRANALHLLDGAALVGGRAPAGVLADARPTGAMR